MDLQKAFEEMPARYPELAGRVAVVTGSSRGIGRGIALRLAREGMKVVINSERAAETEKTAEQFRALGAEVIAVTADLGTTAGVNLLFEQTLSTFGRVDVLVNNAAMKDRMGFFDAPESLVDQELAVNVRGPYLCSLRAAAAMRDQGEGGNIIHISSVGGLRAHWVGLPYDVTKGAIDAMTRAMALELAEYRIRVNAVAPGAIWVEERPIPETPHQQEATRRIPWQRVGYPADIAAAIAFLISPDADYITGQILYVDGGITTQLSPRQVPL